MIEHELLQSMDLARQELAAFRARLLVEGPAPGSPQVEKAMLELHALLEALQARFVALHEVLREANAVLVANERVATTDRDRMRSLAVGIVIVEERLRRTLAAELHTGLGQEIALAKLKLATLRTSASSELCLQLRAIEQLAEQADRSLRSITFQISPPSLHDLGLVAALQWLAEDIGRRYGVVVQVEDDDSPAVGDEHVRVILFRAVRELLVNAATHAGVHAATVSLSGKDGLVRIAVQDTGSGFDPVERGRKGYGLFGIREQLKYVGGEIMIRSSPGLGATVVLTAPIVETVAGATT